MAQEERTPRSTKTESVIETPLQVPHLNILSTSTTVHIKLIDDNSSSMCFYQFTF